MGGLMDTRKQFLSRRAEHEIRDKKEHDKHHPAHHNHGQEAWALAPLAGIARHAMDNRFHVNLDAWSA